MKTIPIAEHSRTLDELLEMALETDLVLQSADGVQFFLARITDAQTFYIGDDDDDFDKETEATRKNERLMAFLDERGKTPSGKGIPLAEVKSRLG